MIQRINALFSSSRNSSQAQTTAHRVPVPESRPGRSVSSQTPAACHSSQQLLQEGRLQIGIAGFNDTAFEVQVLQRHDSRNLSHAIEDLPCRVRMVPRRDVAAGLDTAICMLKATGPGRRSVIVVSSGAPSDSGAALREAVENAASQGIGIHAICLGATSKDEASLRCISTSERLGYGGFYSARTQREFEQALRAALRNSLPSFGMSGRNKAVVLADCSEAMVADFEGSTRVQMIMRGLQVFLQNPLGIRPEMRRTPRSRATRCETDWSRFNSPVPGLSESEWSPGRA